MSKPYTFPLHTLARNFIWVIVPDPLLEVLCNGCQHKDIEVEEVEYETMIVIQIETSTKMYTPFLIGMN